MTSYEIDTFTEVIPGELHDSELTIIFTCAKCKQQYHLKNHVLTRATNVSNNEVNEVNGGKDVTRQANTNVKRHYDA